MESIPPHLSFSLELFTHPKVAQKSARWGRGSGTGYSRPWGYAGGRRVTAAAARAPCKWWCRKTARCRSKPWRTFLRRPTHGVLTIGNTRVNGRLGDGWGDEGGMEDGLRFFLNAVSSSNFKSQRDRRRDRGSLLVVKWPMNQRNCAVSTRRDRRSVSELDEEGVGGGIWSLKNETFVHPSIHTSILAPLNGGLPSGVVYAHLGGLYLNNNPLTLTSPPPFFIHQFKRSSHQSSVRQERERRE